MVLTEHLADTDSMLGSIADPLRAPEMLEIRETVRRWRFYDQFRTDAGAPARLPQIGTYAPVLADDGGNLAAALQTIVETGDVTRSPRRSPTPSRGADSRSTRTALSKCASRSAD